MDNYLNISSLIAFEAFGFLASTKTNQDILFEFFFNKLEEGKASCKTCGRHLVTLYGNSTGLVRHLDTNHRALLANFEEKKKQRDETRKRKTPSAGHKNPSPKRQKEDFFKKPTEVDKELDTKFHDALISHIAKTCTSFNQYSGNSFQKVISVANRRIKVKSRHSLSRLTEKKADQVRDDIAAILLSVKDELCSIGLTTDLWTSLALDTYISLTMTFIDKNWYIHRWNT